MKNVFIKKDGQLEIGGCGRLASLEDLNESLCQGNEPIKGLLQVDEGVVSWFNSNEIEKQDNEDSEEVTEYIEHKHIETLYTEFKNDIDEFVEEIIRLTSDEDDIMLNVLTRGMQNNTIKLYNYYRNNGKIVKEDTTCHISMLSGLFVA